jgi:hypothetical protein
MAESGNEVSMSRAEYDALKAKASAEPAPAATWKMWISMAMAISADRKWICI